MQMEVLEVTRPHLVLRGSPTDRSDRRSGKKRAMIKEHSNARSDDRSNQTRVYQSHGLNNGMSILMLMEHTNGLDGRITTCFKPGIGVLRLCIRSHELSGGMSSAVCGSVEMQPRKIQRQICWHTQRSTYLQPATSLSD